MVKLEEDIEKQVLNIVKKYQKEGLEYLDYSIDGDYITFAISISSGQMLSVEDLQEIAAIIGGCFEKITVVNEQFRFYYTFSEDCICQM